MNTKKCAKCGHQKQFSEFWLREGKPRPYCKACDQTLANAWKREHPNRVNGYARKDRKANPVRALWKGAKDRSRVKGIEFTLAVTDIKIPTHCPILGIELKSGTGNGVRRKGDIIDRAPSVERINNSIGYTPENIIVVSWRANRLKSDGTIDELRRIVEFYDRLGAQNECR